ncbi:Gfo/Idh/MocA family oxidoreductase [Sphingomonas sp. LR61]
MTQQIRIGLFGTGRIGQVHAMSVAAIEDAELAWVCDPFVEGAERTAAEYGGKVSTDPADVFASGAVDAVIIAAPTATHVDLIDAAIDAGVPVLCEKPIDLDLERVDRLRAKAAAATVPIVLGFNRRFDRHFAELHRRVSAGEIGTLEQVLITSRDPAEPPAGYLASSGGIFRDMTIHDLDMARFFVPDIVEVTARGANTFSATARELGDFDSAVVTLRGADDELVVITELAARGVRVRPALRGLRVRGAPAGRQPDRHPRPTLGDRRRRGTGAVPELLPAAVRRGLPARGRRVPEGGAGRTLPQPRVRGRPRRARPRRRRRPVGPHGRISHGRPVAMTGISHDLVATCWTTSGTAVPDGPSERSSFSARDRVSAAADAGFTGLGFVVDDLEVVRDTIGFDALRDHADRLGIGHLEVELVKDWWCDPSEMPWRARWDLLRDAAQALDSPMVKIAPPPAPTVASIEPYVGPFRRLADEAAAIGMRLALEPLPLRWNLLTAAGLRTRRGGGPSPRRPGRRLLARLPRRDLARRAPPHPGPGDGRRGRGERRRCPAPGRPLPVRGHPGQPALPGRGCAGRRRLLLHHGGDRLVRPVGRGDALDRAPCEVACRRPGRRTRHHPAVHPAR